VQRGVRIRGRSALCRDLRKRRLRNQLAEKKEFGVQMDFSKAFLIAVASDIEELRQKSGSPCQRRRNALLCFP